MTQMTTEPKSKASPNKMLAAWELTTQRLSLIRALVIVSVATNGPRDEIDAEFSQAVLSVLEGWQLSQLELTLINKDKVREEAMWLHDRK